VRKRTEITAGQDKYPPESPDEYIAITTRCAHLGCPVRFVQAAGNFICPCHGGVYGFLGERIGGPPVRPLDRFQTRVTNGRVEVGPRFSVATRPVRARDPGEFTGESGVLIRRGPRCRRRPRPMSKRPYQLLRRPAKPEMGQWRERRKVVDRQRSRWRCRHWLDERTRHQRHADALPQGAEGHQLVLHAGSATLFAFVVRR
jgi:hypothetical protein